MRAILVMTVMLTAMNGVVLRALKGALVHAWAQGGDRVEVPKDAWNH